MAEAMMSICSDNMIAYKAACEEHPELKLIDSSIQLRTKKVVDSLSVKDKNGKKPQHALHIEVSEHLLDVTKTVADFLTESQTDVWGTSAGLKSLVLAYFDNTKKTMDIFMEIENCVEDAEMGLLLIEEAVAEFAKESKEKEVSEEKKYVKTVDKLTEFKKLGDPFAGHVFTTQFKLIKEQQETLLKDVSKAQSMIEGEIKDLQREKMIYNVIFGAVVAVVAVVSIALVVSGVGSVAGIAGLAALSSVGGALVTLGWDGVCTTLERKKDALEKDLEELKKLKDITGAVDDGLITNEKALETVSKLIEGLEGRYNFVLRIAENAIGVKENDEAMGRALKKLKEKLEKITEEIKDVGVSLDEHWNLIVAMRLRVQKKIADYDA